MPIACSHCGAPQDEEARFCSRCGTPLGRVARVGGFLPKDLADRFLGPGADLEGQQRQVTVLNVDLVQSTEIMRALGSEGMAELLDELLVAIAASVDRYAGTIVDLAGDGALCIFGAPVAHEDDAERALRAALAIAQAVGEASARRRAALGQDLAVRMGVDTGSVVLRALGGQYRLKYSAVGDSVHLAQRLQAAAGPGEVLVSTTTQRLVGRTFRFDEPRSFSAKGFSAAVTAVRLLGERGAEEPRGLPPTAFVGREAERATVRAKLQELARGVGSIVTVMGEPGIGKSRLVEEAREMLPFGVVWLQGRALSYYQDIPYWTVGDPIRRGALITADDSEQSAREKLRALVRRECGDAKAEEIYPFIAAAFGMGLEAADASTVRRHTGDALLREIHRAIRELLLAVTRRGPVVVALEDLHWADPASATVIEDLLALVEEHPILYLVASRPDRAAPSWTVFQRIEHDYAPRHTAIELRPLSAEESARLARSVLQDDPLPPEVAELVLRKAEGVPLFIEEFTRSLVEQGTLARNGRGWQLAVPLAKVRVPDTLQGVVLARVDRLDDPAKRVLQVASVMGRVFLHRVLAEVLPADVDVARQLELLQRHDLIREERRRPEVEYAFKHALIQDITYQSLLARRRRELHRVVAEAMERLLAERLAEFRSLIAEHFLRAEEWSKASALYLAAGDAARGLYAYAEARLHYAKALVALSHLGEGVEERRRLVDTMTKLVTVSALAEDPGLNLERLREAERLAALLPGADEDALRLARVRFWIGRLHYYRGEHREAVTEMRRVLEVGQRFGDEELVAIPASVIGRAVLSQGRFGEARRLLEDSARRLEASDDWAEWARVIAYLGQALAATGEYARGVAAGERGLARALAENHLSAIGSIRVHLCIVHLFGGDDARLAEEARAAIEMAERSGDVFFAYGGHAFLALALSRQGQAAEAREHMSRSQEIARRLGGRLIITDLFAVANAELAFNAGRYDEARALAQEAARAGEAAGSLYSLGLAHRLWGLALAAAEARRWDEAETHLAKALALLEEGECWVEVARTEMKWGSVCPDPAAALDHLRRAVDRFRASGLVPELAQAAAQVARLRKRQETKR